MESIRYSLQWSRANFNSAWRFQDNWVIPKEHSRDDIYLTPAPGQKCIISQIKGYNCVGMIIEKRRTAMGINFGMWKTAAWELVKMEDKKEWDALDVVSKWLIATR